MKILAGDFLKDGSCYIKEGMYLAVEKERTAKGMLSGFMGGLLGLEDKNQDFEYISLDEVEELEVATEESVKRIGGAIGWGVAGSMLLGSSGLLAGLLLGGKSKEIVFVCKFKDGRKLLGKATNSDYERLLAGTFK